MKRIVTAGVAALGLALVVPQVAHSAETHRQNGASYTMAQVATHNTSTDCWSAVNGGAYNLTTWLPRHTFGPFTVAAICGVESSAIFNSFARVPNRVSVQDGHGGEHSRGGHDGGDDRSKQVVSNVRSARWFAQGSDHGHGNRFGSNPALRSISRYRIGSLVVTAPVPVPVPTVTPTATPTATPTPTPTPTVTPTATPTPTVTPTPTATTFTLAQVATHNTIANCWTAISGKVYNLSDWAATHRGGTTVLLDSICGKDGTTAFAQQHGTSAGPAAVLASRQIGTLV